MQARLEAPADPRVRLLRVYSGGGLKWASSPEGLQEFLEGNEEYYRVWSHPEPLRYTVENVAAYIRAAFALTNGDRERSSVVPAAEGESSTLATLEGYVWVEIHGRLSAEKFRVWKQMTDRFFRHPYGIYLGP